MTKDITITFPHIAGHVNTVRNKSNTDVQMLHGGMKIDPSRQELFIAHNSDNNETIYLIKDKQKHD